jgi:protein pelota
VKAEIRSKLPGKLECEKREKALKKYFGDVLKFLTAIHKDADGKIVVVGPSFTKDGFLKFVKDQAPDVASSVVAVKSVSTGGVAGVHESLRSGIISKVLKDARAAEETMLVEEVLSRLGASRKDVSFGLTEVEEDAVAGAVDTLLVCDKSLREATENERNRLDEIMRIVEERGGKIMIISSEHEGGRKLISLGGVASLLRYPKR